MRAIQRPVRVTKRAQNEPKRGVFEGFLAISGTETTRIIDVHGRFFCIRKEARSEPDGLGPHEAAPAPATW